MIDVADAVLNALWLLAPWGMTPAQCLMVVQASVLRDARLASVTAGSGPDFEKWIKSGFGAFPHLSAADFGHGGGTTTSIDGGGPDSPVGVGSSGATDAGEPTPAAASASAAAHSPSPIAAVMAMAAAASAAVAVSPTGRS